MVAVTFQNDEPEMKYVVVVDVRFEGERSGRVPPVIDEVT